MLALPTFKQEAEVSQQEQIRQDKLALVEAKYESELE